MEIYKNKSSGKYFIYLDDIDADDSALFVTPLCKVISIKLDFFFDEPKEGDEVDFVSEGIITKAQLERYRQYNKDRNNEFGDRFEDIDLAPSRTNGLKNVGADDKSREKEPDMIERVAKDFKRDKVNR